MARTAATTASDKKNVDAAITSHRECSAVCKCIHIVIRDFGFSGACCLARIKRFFKIKAIPYNHYATAAVAAVFGHVSKASTSATTAAKAVHTILSVVLRICYIATRTVAAATLAASNRPRFRCVSTGVVGKPTSATTAVVYFTSSYGTSPSYTSDTCIPFCSISTRALYRAYAVAARAPGTATTTGPAMQMVGFISNLRSIGGSSARKPLPLIHGQSALLNTDTIRHIGTRTATA